MKANTSSPQDTAVSKQKTSSFNFLSGWLSAFSFDHDKEIAELKKKLQEKEQRAVAQKAESEALAKLETTLKNMAQGLDTYLDEAQVTQKALSSCLSETELKTALSAKATQDNCPASASAMHLSLAQLDEHDALHSTDSKPKPQEIERGALEIEEYANQTETVAENYLSEAHGALRRQTALAAAQKEPAKAVVAAVAVTPAWTSIYNKTSSPVPESKEKPIEIDTKTTVVSKFPPQITRK